MSDRIERRRTFAGTGMMTDPERIQELDDRRAQHERLTRGKPQRTFQSLLEEKMRGPEAPPVEDDTPAKGAKDPHLGLSPGQDATLSGATGSGRRSGRVIVKG